MNVKEVCSHMPETVSRIDSVDDRQTDLTHLSVDRQRRGPAHHRGGNRVR